ncbi:hypothetical protein NC651_032990 [Populus alba x Populus x berolinensis]|uniref:Uncharacterized protein n=2 Tax=Populus alba TaxID=43335 RepID=A0A4U5QB65_POPAL|nr:uncharacterized protein At3g49055 [Populus alba]KAJ6867818.1 hypothetical protein NC651_032990 [Populus alba x Populus x berolinensis]TKS07282.1 uncharacterized protein D5086_0000116140 [Populus alba]
METTSQNPPQPYINDLADSPTNANFIISDHHDLLSQLQSLQHSFDTIQGKSSLMEENLLLFQQQRDDALDNNTQLKLAIQEVSHERDSLRDQVRELEASFKEKEDGLVKRIDEAYLTMEKLEKEMEFLRERNDKLELEIKEARDKNGFLLKINMDLVRPVKESLVKVTECVHDEYLIERSDTEENREELDLDDELRSVWEEFKAIARLAGEAESKVNEFNEMKKKEIRELESSVVSLTEENRDINSLLRVALVEKEAVERSLNKLKGNNEQKRVALLQFAERGLQRVGFGFMMGSGSNEQSMESSGAGSNTTNASAAASSKSDSSEFEEEVVSLASTMERIMKNLRLENSQLRRSLEESRSDAERLQSLVQKQDKEIAENTLYIKELENRERVQAQNVEELLTEIKESEAEVVRWREACELEVEAAKKAIEEREKLVVILKQELEKTKANLEISNGKLKLKDELAVAAMAAQAAAERSLQLADSRASGLRQRIEELTRQVEEAESKERRCNKVRHICWPWRAIKAATASTANNRVQNARRRMLPEMQALLHHNV